jgi:uncharacterized membrane protein required for colicin V production
LKAIQIAITFIITSCTMWLTWKLYRYGLSFLISDDFLSVIGSMVQIIISVLLSHMLIPYLNKNQIFNENEKPIDRN